MINSDSKADFCIVIDYEKDSENPSRVFKCMSALLDNLQEIDHILIQSVNTDLKPVLLLEDIESGSIRTWLNQKVIRGLKEIDDDALKDLDWKKQIGKYLVKGKYLLIDFIEKRTQVTDSREIIELQQNLLAAAEDTQIMHLPLYTPVSTQNLIKSVGLISQPLEYLDKRDKMGFISEEGNGSFNLDFEFAPEKIEELFVKEIIDSTSTMILKVKKPDYLSSSMWEFKHERKLIQAKITDYDWLNKFQGRQVDIRPGDSIRASVRTSVKYGFDYDVVSMSYEIIKVITVLNNISTNQTSLLPDESDGPTA